jgi:hypothetical protein
VDRPDALIRSRCVFTDFAQSCRVSLVAVATKSAWPVIGEAVKDKMVIDEFLRMRLCEIERDADIEHQAIGNGVGHPA